jgi:predicted DNA-binding transcriptional regulator YafY
MRFTTSQYDALEAALRDGQRVALVRRGTEYIVVPSRLSSVGGREAVQATHPTTGDVMTFVLDELDRFEVVR